MESQWETPTSTLPQPQGAKTIVGGGGEVALVALTDYRVSDGAGKVSNLQPFGGRRGDEVTYTYTTWGFLIFINIFYRLHALRSHGAPNRRAKCSKTCVPMHRSTFWGFG